MIECYVFTVFFFFSSRRRHTRLQGDWSSDVCSSDLRPSREVPGPARLRLGDAAAVRQHADPGQGDGRPLGRARGPAARDADRGVHGAAAQGQRQGEVALPERGARVRRQVRPRGRRPFTLSIDIGGTGLKASVLDARGRMTGEPGRVLTPSPCTPRALLSALDTLVAPLPAFDRVSIGFPGVVRDGLVITAQHFRQYFPARFPLAQAVRRRWGKPVKLLNDADMQGSAVVRGKGLELVVTLGTGMGSALFLDGMLLPHLELAQHPSPSGKTYNEYIGDKVLKRI